MEYDNDENTWRRPSSLKEERRRCSQVPRRSSTAAVVVLGLAVLSCLLGYCVLSETLPYESRTLRQVIIVAAQGWTHFEYQLCSCLTNKYLLQFFRHGARTPTTSYKSDPFKAYQWPEGLGGLTNEHNIEGVNTYSLHPGVVRTELGRHLDASLFRGARRLIGIAFGAFFKSPELGAQTTIYCSVDEKCANETGLYYSDCAVTAPARKALNDEYAEKLWNISTDLVGLKDYNPFTTVDSGIKENK